MSRASASFRACASARVIHRLFNQARRIIAPIARRHKRRFTHGSPNLLQRYFKQIAA
ncbi:hypothetical protein [Erwinia oleae]|uniref:hypothetical protein n=1 Tax=Erwinia oleae TaxID=796334 RepID=UPI001363BF96|nr:hypothetical protein [Erwinia oleae]